MKFSLLLFAAALGCGTVGAAELPRALEIRDDGSFSIGDLSFFTVHYNPMWAPTRQTPGAMTLAPGEPRRSACSFSTAGEFRVYGGEFQLNETIRAVGDGRAEFELRLSSRPALAANTLALATQLAGESYAGTTIRVDGKPFTLPEKFQERVAMQAEQVRSIELPFSGGRATFTGNFELLIQDNRGFNQNSFDIRFYLVPPSQSKVETAELKLGIAIESVVSTPLGIMKTARSGFSDGVRTPYRPEPLRVAGIDFTPSDPVAADGALELPEKAKGGMLYLLHFLSETAEGDAGTIEVLFADGSRQTIPVRRGIDAAGWKNPVPLPNGAVVWSANGDDFHAGILMSGFRLDRNDPAAIRLTAAPGSGWSLAAATLASDAVDLGKIEGKFYPVPGPEWAPVEAYQWIRKDSPLDFSGFTEAPAGKYGRLIPDGNGHFVTEQDPAKRVRLLGVNLCFSANFPDRELAGRLADDLVRSGYNAVRLHHFEQMLADPAGKSSLDFSAEEQDKLDYLFAACKERGMYVTIDLYCSRRVRPGELPDYDGDEMHFMKALTPLMDSAFENWKAFARKLLTHRNPHTGMTWAEDPALFCVNLLNENSLVIEWNASPRLTAIYEKAFSDWKRENRLPAETPDRAEHDRLFRRFLVEKQSSCIRRMSAFLREEIGLKAAITDVNWQNLQHLSPVRENLDVVDNHMYWDHPSFPGEAWKLPNAYQQWSSTALMAENPRRMMPTRIFGKPFIVTEYQFCTPNRFRSEGGPLMGAYAGLQDWDGLFRFAWAHNRNYLMKPYTNAGFDIVQDPVNRLAERIIFFLFRRGDVAAAKEARALPITTAMIDAEEQNFPAGFESLGLSVRIGTAAAKNPPPGVTLVSGGDYPAALPDRAVSSTGEIEISSAPALRVVTPKSECLVLKEGDAAGKRLSVSGADTFQTVAVASLDDKPIDQSTQLLFLQLTDVKNTIGRFATGEMKLVEYWGELPQLVRRDTVDVRLELPPGEWSVTALELDGKEKTVLPSNYADGALSFTADTAVSMVCVIRKQSRND